MNAHRIRHALPDRSSQSSPVYNPVLALLRRGRGCLILSLHASSSTHAHVRPQKLIYTCGASDLHSTVTRLPSTPSRTVFPSHTQLPCLGLHFLTTTSGGFTRGVGTETSSLTHAANQPRSSGGCRGTSGYFRRCSQARRSHRFFVNVVNVFRRRRYLYSATVATSEA